MCVSKLDDEWWAYYKWFPNNYADDDLDALINEKITQAEYDRISEEKIDSCWRDGLAAMGYEIPKNGDH